MTRVMWFHRWAAVWEPRVPQVYGFTLQAGEFPATGFFITRTSAQRYASGFGADRFGGTPGRWRILRKGEQ